MRSFTTHGAKSNSKGHHPHEGRTASFTDTDFTEARAFVSTAYEVANALGVPCSGEDWDRILKIVAYCKFTSVHEALAGMLRLNAAVVEFEVADGCRPARLLLGNRGDSIDLLGFVGILRPEGVGG
jgi:hypothetical protein